MRREAAARPLGPIDGVQRVTVVVKPAKSLYRDLWKTVSRGQTWSGRMVNKRKDGKLYTEETTISPVRDPLGKIVNYVAAISPSILSCRANRNSLRR